MGLHHYLLLHCWPRVCCVVGRVDLELNDQKNEKGLVRDGVVTDTFPLHSSSHYPSSVLTLPPPFFTSLFCSEAELYQTPSSVALLWKNGWTHEKVSELRIRSTDFSWEGEVCMFMVHLNYLDSGGKMTWSLLSRGRWLSNSWKPSMLLSQNDSSCYKICWRFFQSEHFLMNPEVTGLVKSLARFFA
jgi:hypothetical protein